MSYLSIGTHRVGNLFAGMNSASIELASSSFWAVRPLATTIAKHGWKIPACSRAVIQRTMPRCSSTVFSKMPWQKTLFRLILSRSICIVSGGDCSSWGKLQDCLIWRQETLKNNQCLIFVSSVHMGRILRRAHLSGRHHLRFWLPFWVWFYLLILSAICRYFLILSGNLQTLLISD